MGRKKIGISRIENKASRMVTLTKRRKGLFKKAYELGTLCGANVAIIAFSTVGNPFAFGHPSVDPVIDCYCDYYSHGGHDPDPTPMPSSNLHSVNTISMQLEQQIQTHLHDQCSHGSWSRTYCDGEGYWWDRVNIDDLVELSDLERLKERLERLRENVWSRVVIKG